MIVLGTAEVLKRLNLKDSTLTKYLLSLEKEGYFVEKNSSNRRSFTEDNIRVLKTFLELLTYDGVTVEMAAKKIAEMEGQINQKEKKESKDIMVLIKENEAYQIQQLEEKTKFLLEQQKNDFLRLLEERDKKQLGDRDKLLMKSIKETQELKKMMLEVKEQIAASTKEKKSWWEFWK